MPKLAENCFFPVENIRFLKSAEKTKHSLTNFHVHSYWEVKVFPDGDKDSKKPVILLAPPDIVHEATFRMFSRESNFVLAFSQPKSVLQTFYNDEDERDLFFDFLKLDDLCPGGIDAYINKLQAIRLSKMEKESQEKLLNQLLAVLFSAAEIAIEADKGIAFSPIERACDLIERQYHRGDLTVEQVAAYIGVTPGHLANLFKNEGMGTVRQYLVEMRLKHAMSLLKTGRYTVKDAAQLTGWNNQFYFSNSFKKYYNISPSTVMPDDSTKIVG